MRSGKSEERVREKIEKKKWKEDERRDEEKLRTNWPGKNRAEHLL